MKIIPKSLQGVLWSTSVEKLDLEKNKDYIIHNILTYGSMKHIRWLKKVYKIGEITSVFINYPKKQYTPSSYNFVKNYILQIDKKLLENRYVKDLPRDIR